MTSMADITNTVVIHSGKQISNFLETPLVKK